MWLSEMILYSLARLSRKSTLAQSDQMKDAVTGMDAYDAYRCGEVEAVLGGARRYDVDLSGVVVDLGCHDGAITREYAGVGCRAVIGVDIDEKAIARANKLHAAANTRYVVSGVDRIPLDDASVDAIVSYDVFEHIADLPTMLDECYRILRPGGKVLAGTWGWRHPFAPHLWSVMPVPYAHVFFSERTVLRACRRVYTSPWYTPTMHDLDAQGRLMPDKYLQESIPTDYLNKLLIADYHRLFEQSRFQWRTHRVPFKSRLGRWTRVFLSVPWLGEFVTGYLWAVLTKPPMEMRRTG